jgi:hypothetical protein
MEDIMPRIGAGRLAVSGHEQPEHRCGFYFSRSFFKLASIIPQFFSACSRDCSVGLLSWLSETRVRGGSCDSVIVTVIVGRRIRKPGKRAEVTVLNETLRLQSEDHALVLVRFSLPFSFPSDLATFLPL